MNSRVCACMCMCVRAHTRSYMCLSIHEGVGNRLEEKLEVVFNFFRHPCMNLVISVLVYYFYKLKKSTKVRKKILRKIFVQKNVCWVGEWRRE